MRDTDMANAMPSPLIELHGFRILECPADGPKLRSGRDATEVLSEAFSHHANVIVIPISRFDDDFFELKTRIAGEVISKFVVYGMHTAIIGDITAKVNESSSLKAFVAECNRGSSVWFLKDADELHRRLSHLAQNSEARP
jgi:hypothetical protein